MLQESQDLLLEARELDSLLDRLKDEQWDRPTTFMEWTPWDVVAHLHYFDLVSLEALKGEEVFATERDALMKRIMSGSTNTQIASGRFGDMKPDELRRRWLESCEEMATQLHLFGVHGVVGGYPGCGEARRELPVEALRSRERDVRASGQRPRAEQRQARVSTSASPTHPAGTRAAVWLAISERFSIHCPNSTSASLFSAPVRSWVFIQACILRINKSARVRSLRKSSM